MHPFSHSSVQMPLKTHHHHSQFYLPGTQHSSSRFNSGMTHSRKNFLPLLFHSFLPDLTMHSLYPICIFITVYKALCTSFSLFLLLDWKQFKGWGYVFYVFIPNTKPNAQYIQDFKNIINSSILPYSLGMTLYCTRAKPRPAL